MRPASHFFMMANLKESHFFMIAYPWQNLKKNPTFSCSTESVS
jgi:hypothetical protein